MKGRWNDDADYAGEVTYRFYLGEDAAYKAVVENTNLIADMCETLRPVPHNLFAPSIENSVEDLKALVYGKFHRLYGENPPELMVKRVETELHDIISCHYDVIYMSAQKLGAWCAALRRKLSSMAMGTKLSLSQRSLFPSVFPYSCQL